MKKKQHPNNEIAAKNIAIISLLSDILKEPPMVDASISNAKAIKAEPPINLAVILDNTLNLGTNIDSDNNRLNNKNAIDHNPTPKILEL